MITRTHCQTLIESAIDYAAGKADGIEVTVSASDMATSRFAGNSMTQNQSPEHASVAVRVLKDGKQSRLTSDRVGIIDVNNLVDAALTAASFLEKDEELQSLPAPQIDDVVRDVNRYDSATAKFSAADRAACVRSICDIARKQKLSAAGVYANGSKLLAIGNSQGLFRFHKETSAECSVTMQYTDPKTGVESTGWSKLQSTRVKDVNAEQLATRAASKAIASADPYELPPGRYTVILEPSAVLDLMCFIYGDLTGTSHIDKLSCFLNKLGSKQLGDNITLADDPYHKLQSGAPFDGEGVQRSKLVLIDKGTIATLALGRRSAALLGEQPTGHGVPQPSPQDEFPMNLVVTGGKVSLDEMIKSTQNGILLTRVWYVREVDPTSKIITGMTRDGTFLIENGTIKCGIKNFRFNESVLEMLNSVTAIGPSERACGEEGFPAVVPAMKVDNFHFSSVTRF
jgi:predicted Zn-dependent protease